MTFDTGWIGEGELPEPRYEMSLGCKSCGTTALRLVFPDVHTPDQFPRVDVWLGDFIISCSRCKRELMQSWAETKA